MRHIANAYLFAYFLDAFLSVADEALKYLFGFDGLIHLRNYIAYVVLFWSFVMLILIGIDARLPKRVLLPPIIYLMWCYTTPAPLDLLLSGEYLSMSLSVLQLIFSIASYGFLRSVTAGKLLLTANDLAGPVFRWKYSAVYFGFGFFVFVGVFIYAIYLGIQASLYHYTAGFARLDKHGIYLVEKEYAKENNVIRLVGMIHIGDTRYYKNTFQSLVESNTLVLMEGVTDYEGVIKSFPSYSKIAGFLGLSQQSHITPNLLQSYQQGNTDEETKTSQDDGLPELIRADIDMSELRPETIDYINQLGIIVKNNDSLGDTMIELYKWSLTNVTPESEAIIREDIYDRRNEVLVSHLDDWLDKYKQIIIPWGALHMPAFEQAVLERGFNYRSQQERLAIQF